MAFNFKGSDFMIRGTTAQFKFQLPYKYSEIKFAKVVFWQPGNNGPSEDRPLPIVKTKDQNGSQCYQSGENELSVKLAPEETLRFTEKNKAYVQLTATMNDETRFASRQEQITVYPIYDDSILGDIVVPSPDDDGWIIIDGGAIE